MSIIKSDETVVNRSNPLVEEFNKSVDVNCAKLVDSFRTIISKSIIQEVTTHNDELLLSTALENIVSVSDFELTQFI